MVVTLAIVMLLIFDIGINYQVTRSSVTFSAKYTSTVKMNVPATIMEQHVEKQDNISKDTSSEIKQINVRPVGT